MKKILSILSFFILFTSCEQDDYSTITQAEITASKSEFSIKRIHANQILKWDNYKAKTFKGNAFKSNETIDYIDTDFGHILVDQVKAVSDTLGNTNYTFRVKPKKYIPDAFVNFVIEESSDPSIPLKGSYRVYKMSTEFTSDYHKGIAQAHEFKGEIKIYNDDTIVSQVTSKGSNIPDITCPDPTASTPAGPDCIIDINTGNDGNNDDHTPDNPIDSDNADGQSGTSGGGATGNGPGGGPTGGSSTSGGSGTGSSGQYDCTTEQICIGVASSYYDEVTNQTYDIPPMTCEEAASNGYGSHMEYAWRTTCTDGTEIWFTKNALTGNDCSTPGAIAVTFDDMPDAIGILDVIATTENEVVQFINWINADCDRGQALIQIINDNENNPVINTAINEVYQFLQSGNTDVDTLSREGKQIFMDYLLNEAQLQYTPVSPPQKFLDRPGLEYDATASDPWGTFYHLTNGKGHLYVSQSKMGINRDYYNFDSETPINGAYIYHRPPVTSNEDYPEFKWTQVTLPSLQYDCLYCDLNAFFNSTLYNSGVFIGRYVIPVEDVLIVITGEDFNGQKQSRAVAATFLLIDIIPGGKLVTRVIRPAGQVITNASPIIRRVVSQAYKNQKAIVEQYKNIIGNMSNARKGNFGEIAVDVDMFERGYKDLHVNKVTDIDAAGHTGIDGIFKNEVTGEYIIIEGKFGSQSMSAANPATGLPRQMSDDWIFHNDNLLNALGGNQQLYNNIIANGYTKLRGAVDSSGNVVYQLINDFGYMINSIFTP